MISPLAFTSAPFQPINKPQEIYEIQLEELANHIQANKVSNFAYKKVANRIKPVSTTLPENFRIVRRIPSDPLETLPTLPTRPPNFTPGLRYTLECKTAMNVNPNGFLWPDEEKLVHHLIKTQEMGLAWTEEEKGKFSSEYFDPITIPTIEHIPWAIRNIPIPPGLFNRVVDIIKAKIAAGVYEPSSSSYRSRWFCVLKKDGKSLRLIHDLQPLNAVTIKDSGVPPIIENYAESFGGRSCYTVFDLLVGYDQRELALESRNLTTFQSPLGTLRLTSIPMGYTNSLQIQHGDLTFLLQEEIPEIAVPFVDDVPVKGPRSRYETNNGFETIPDNPGIRRFVWEHLQDANRIIQCIKHAGGTFSGPKLRICTPTTVVVGHLCTYEGRLPDTSRIQKIVDWPPCTTATEVRGFLGVLGTIRIFIQDFTKIARPLVSLTKKNVEFRFGDEELHTMETLKRLAQNSPCIHAIDYNSTNEVILGVDTSYIAIGYILQQLGDDKKRYPSRFGSITLNDRESRYSQAKLELFGLFRALKDVRLWIIGVQNLVVEVDAKYIRGMINNPDVQPSAVINRWISAILLFDFRLRHVPGKEHGADGLSRRPQAPQDPIIDDDYDEWIDTANAFPLTQPDHLHHSGIPLWIDTINTFAIEFINDPPLPPPRISVMNVHRTTQEFSQTKQAPNSIIPRSDKARLRDQELQCVHTFLLDSQRPPDLSTTSEFA